MGDFLLMLGALLMTLVYLSPLIVFIIACRELDKDKEE